MNRKTNLSLLKPTAPLLDNPGNQALYYSMKTVILVLHMLSVWLRLQCYHYVTVNV